ncbi:MAG: hypothetical protein IAE79_26835 [Anaerolinea sp.]|nr:hypothetical protein [Anaerolinea sp.]
MKTGLIILIVGVLGSISLLTSRKKQPLGLYIVIPLFVVSGVVQIGLAGLGWWFEGPGKNSAAVWFVLLLLAMAVVITSLVIIAARLRHGSIERFEI